MLIDKPLSRYTTLVITMFVVFFFVLTITYAFSMPAHYNTCHTELQAVEKKITEIVDANGTITVNEIKTICNNLLSCDSYEIINAKTNQPVTDLEGSFYGDDIKLFIEREDYYLGENHKQNIFITCRNHAKIGTGYDLPNEH